MKYPRLYEVLLIAVLLGSVTQAVTPEHPNHTVRLDRLQADGAVIGQYLQYTTNGWRPVDGGLIPIFVDNAMIGGAAVGRPEIAQNTTTGVLTLPSAPNPPASLDLKINGLTQAFGKDFILSGMQVTPAAANVDLYRKAVEGVASYRQ